MTTSHRRSGDPARYGGFVGFNPFRSQSKSWVDVTIVVVAFAVILALVAWAAFG